MNMGVFGSLARNVMHMFVFSLIIELSCEFKLTILTCLRFLSQFLLLGYILELALEKFILALDISAMGVVAMKYD